MKRLSTPLLIAAFVLLAAFVFLHFVDLSPAPGPGYGLYSGVAYASGFRADVVPTATTVAPTPPATPAPVTPSLIPTIDQLTPALLSAFVAALISMIFRFVPGATGWFETLDGQRKQLFMLTATVIVAAFIGIWNMAHTGISEQSVIVLLLTVYTALTSNQATYQFIKS